MIYLLLFVVITLFASTTQALTCNVGYAFPDAHGQIPSNSNTNSNSLLVSMTCGTKCLLAFVKTAQQPTGQIVASCSSTSDSSCDSGFVLDVNTWTEIKCCSTDNCNSPTGNVPWANYDWTTPRNPNLGTSQPTTTTTTTDAPTDTPTNQPTQPTNTNTIQCTAGTSVPDGQGGVIKQVVTQACTTQCYAIYTHSSFGPTNQGTIAGGCSTDTNRECSFQGTTVNQLNSNQWVQVKCCNTDNCNSQDWNAGQYDWSTPRGNTTIIGTITGTPTTTTTTQQPTGTSTAGTTIQPSTGAGTGTGTGTGTGQVTSKPTPTAQPIGGNNNKTLSSTGIHSSSAFSIIVSPVVLVIVMVISVML